MKLFLNTVFSPISGIKFEAFTTEQAADAHLVNMAGDILGKDHPVLKGDIDVGYVLATLDAKAGPGYEFDRVTNDLQTEFDAERYT